MGCCLVGLGWVRVGWGGLLLRFGGLGWVVVWWVGVGCCCLVGWGGLGISFCNSSARSARSVRHIL